MGVQVTGFATGGGVFFSVALDMAVVSWKKPQDANSTDKTIGQLLGASNNKPVAQPTQKYGHARVVHRAPVTAVAVADDFLLTADADGFVLLHKAAK
jgi:hypothetical protein